MTRSELESMFTDMGQKPFRARQIMKWVYGRSVRDLAQMTDLSADLRNSLAGQLDFGLPEIQLREDAADGVVKWQLAAGGGQANLQPAIPDDRHPQRG